MRYLDKVQDSKDEKNLGMTSEKSTPPSCTDFVLGVLVRVNH